MNVCICEWVRWSAPWQLKTGLSSSFPAFIWKSACTCQRQPGKKWVGECVCMKLVRLKCRLLTCSCESEIWISEVKLSGHVCYSDSFIRRRNRRPPDEIFITSSSMFETDPVCTEGRGLDKGFSIWQCLVKGWCGGCCSVSHQNCVYSPSVVMGTA